MEAAQDTAKPFRMSLSMVIDRLLTKHGGGGKRPGVTISRTAAGATTFEVVANAGDDDTPEALKAAGLIAQAEYERLAELFPHVSHEASSVTLTRNAKGETQIALSADTSKERPTLELVSAAAETEYNRLRGQYPMASGQSAAAGSVS